MHEHIGYVIFSSRKCILPPLLRVMNVAQGVDRQRPTSHVGLFNGDGLWREQTLLQRAAHPTAAAAAVAQRGEAGPVKLASVPRPPAQTGRRVHAVDGSRGEGH
jgi:hypothetical protein